MDCRINQEKLVDFHFGNLDAESRTQQETHLMDCPNCLQEFFLIKRDVESAAVSIVRPDIKVKVHIMAEFAHYARSQFRENPKPMILGGLMAAAAAALLLLFAKPNQNLSKEPSNKSAPQAETVRSLDDTVDSGGSNPGHIHII